MLIPVLYDSQKLGMVYPSRLDKLIHEKKILAFRRSTGWVFLDEDSVRGNGYDDAYSGPERRKHAVTCTQLETTMKEYEIFFECDAGKNFFKRSESFTKPLTRLEVE
ncbi:MAG TPA: hypothetical protein VFG19_03785 [Geobacteraceae bacterium]|nr:hypothetical protein [Geobacteraceae bacterium]